LLYRQLLGTLGLFERPHGISSPYCRLLRKCHLLSQYPFGKTRRRPSPFDAPVHQVALSPLVKLHHAMSRWIVYCVHFFSHCVGENFHSQRLQAISMDIHRFFMSIVFHGCFSSSLYWILNPIGLLRLSITHFAFLILYLKLFSSQCPSWSTIPYSIRSTRYLHSRFEVTPLTTTRSFPRKTFGVTIYCSELESTKETVRQFTHLSIPIIGRQHASEYRPGGVYLRV
jgi:hypothetical protein